MSRACPVSYVKIVRLVGLPQARAMIREAQLYECTAAGVTRLFMSLFRAACSALHRAEGKAWAAAAAMDAAAAAAGRFSPCRFGALAIVHRRFCMDASFEPGSASSWTIRSSQAPRVHGRFCMDVSAAGEWGMLIGPTHRGAVVGAPAETHEVPYRGPSVRQGRHHPGPQTGGPCHQAEVTYDRKIVHRIPVTTGGVPDASSPAAGPGSCWRCAAEPGACRAQGAVSPTKRCLS